MLRTLHIRDFVIVERTDIEFEPGFTVFSGETGAGKSILINALDLVLGGRADADTIREGASRAEISASFDVPAHLRDWLADLDLDSDALILRRVIDAGGRSRAYLNGTPVPVSQLRELGDLLVDVHGQHAHHSLLRAEVQRDLLDAHGQLQPQALVVQAAWQAWRTAREALELQQRDAERLRQEREAIEWQLDELDQLAPLPGEWDALQGEHQRLAHAQDLLEGVAATLDELDEADQSARRQLARAQQRLAGLGQHDAALRSVEQTLADVNSALADALSDLHSYLHRLEPDPGRLEALDERLRTTLMLARKHHVSPEALPEHYAGLRTRRDSLRQAEDLDALQAAEAAAATEYQAAAEGLHQGRAQAATALGTAVTRLMQTLAMGGSHFAVALSPQAPGPHGTEQVVFQVAGHAAGTARPLARVASGGELSRIALALSVIASQAAWVPTLIFDEVDSGISGAVAEVVGRLLRELGTRHQVLCVTHLPQVAAHGNQHLLVQKEGGGQQAARSSIRPLNEDGRVAELARLLGGITMTDTTRRHAAEMLEHAGAQPDTPDTAT